MEKTSEVLKRFVESGQAAQSAVKQAIAEASPQQPQRDMRKRIVTVTVLGPDASPIATGLLSSLKQVAADIMERRKGVAVSVKLEEI